jgi:ABC-type branched-subunit amino acid transport system substrate-binding protein
MNLMLSTPSRVWRRGTRPGGARGVFLDHLKSRMRRVVRGHDQPYSIIDPFGAWPNEDWWGGTETYMLDHIKNVITPEIKESGCQYDFYCLELWRDLKGDIEHPNPTTYPKGFGNIRDELAKLDIKFALWNDVSGPLSWTCGENPKVQPNVTYDPTAPYPAELPWLCIAEDPLKSMFTQAFVNHIRKNNLRLLKMDGNSSICYNPHHNHLPGVYSTEAIWNAIADITHALDKECPDLFIMLYWGCRSPWHLMYGDTSFDPGLALEAAHPSANPAPYIRDSITVGLDQAHWFCEDTPKLGKDSLGVWLSRWGWNSGVGKQRWQEGFLMDLCRGSLLAQPWSDDGSLSKDERHQLADFIALLKERPSCFRNPRFILGNPWKNEPYGYCCTDSHRAFLAINNCTWSDQALRLELNSTWGLPEDRSWDIYRWHPAPAKLVADGASFGKTALLGIRPYEVTLLEVVPAGSEPSLGRHFETTPLISQFVVPSRCLDVKIVSPASSEENKADAPAKRTLNLNCQLPASPSGGLFVLAVEMQKYGLAFNMGGNGNNFAQAAVKSAISTFGKRWLLVTNDYVWGHTTSAATRKLAEASGADIVGEILVPQGTRDFSAVLLKVQQKKPDVVAAAVGGDDQKSMRAQVAQMKLGDKYAWINNQQDWPDIYGLGPDAIFGVFGTNWYWRLDLPGVKEFVAAYQKQYPGIAIRTPGNVYYNGYMATRELLKAVERAGTTNNLAVIKELENLKVSARDRMQHFDAYMNPATHQLQQTIYMASYNDAPAEKTDIFKILTQTEPKDVVDADSSKICKLESYDATPSYER